ncbi:MAG TPA: DUF547 domain-containing protein [Stellaceae bacterium]|nr:DUF547 domain-containing protein [Stellaceae bacterium]
MSLIRVLPGVILAVALVGCAQIESLAAPRSQLISGHWLQTNAASTEHVNHDPWSRFLATYLVPGRDGVNRFDYARAQASGRATLESYISMLQATPVSQLNRAEQRAYWINLYNAVTTRIVLDHYPTRSIRDISLGPGLFSIGPWDAKVVQVEGERLSLNDIEHGILRPIWRDPRLHYALNCAAISCPSLPRVAFTAENTERLLEDGARAYVNDPRGVRIEDGRLIVSSIYLWYRSDFGRDEAAVMDHLRHYAAPELVAQLGRWHAPDGYAYDWRLIDVPRPEREAR